MQSANGNFTVKGFVHFQNKKILIIYSPLSRVLTTRDTTRFQRQAIWLFTPNATQHRDAMESIDRIESNSRLIVSRPEEAWSTKIY